MKKRLLPLLLALALLLTSCTPIWDIYQEMQNGNTWSAPNYDDGPIDYADFVRPYEGYEEYVSFDGLTYARPDADALCRSLNEVALLAATAGEAELINAYDEAYEAYTWFYTMGNLAYLRYTLDLNDSYYETEYQWCEEQSPLVEQALEECYIAMGRSDLRDTLERDYFGEDFFTSYDNGGFYSDEQVVALFQQEAELESRYMAMQSDMTVNFQGREQLVDELLSDPSITYNDYYDILELYYEKYNPQAAEIYIQLVQVRRELAQRLGYESYAAFAYAFNYYRDYTPAQAETYIEAVRQQLVPVYEDAAIPSQLPSAEMDDVMSALRQSVRTIGMEPETAYGFMEAYQLYDASVSSSKMPGSYATYLESYEMPYVFLSPVGDLSDLLTAAHEFGHFVDSFVNCNTTTSIDCAEVFSQGLEYLTLDAADLSAREQRLLREYKLYDALEVFITQSCYYAFECRVFDLDDEELTTEKLNQVFLECSRDYGLCSEGYEDFTSRGWIDIQHFFIAPFYVISYCVSNDAALQIYQSEQAQSGNGLELYRKLLYAASNNTFLAMLAEGEISSPFDAGRVAQVADFFQKNL